jgi:hypothetical protein
MPVRNVLSCLLVGVLVACATCAPIAAQSNTSQSKVTPAAATPAASVSGYDKPPKNILDVMLAVISKA